MADKTIVYILGAGASAEGNSAPVMKELTDRAFWLYGGQMKNSNVQLMGGIRNERDLSSFREAFRLIDRLCETCLVKKLDELQESALHTPGLRVDIEDLFTKIDNISKRKEVFPTGYDEDAFREAARDASYFFYHTLCHVTGSCLNHPSYLDFVNLVLTPGTKHCVITFNYDTLLERAICEKCSALPKERRLRWTYAVSFASDISRIPCYIRDESIAEIFLLKLHGSFNWGLCPETKEIMMQPPVAGVYQYKRFHDGQILCCDGNHAQEPLLIPPTLEKDLNVSALRELWKKKARDFLSKADELHVIGYSAPEADIAARELFSKILQPRASELEKIVLANRGANSRIRSLLNSTDCVEYNTFADYLNNVKK